MITGLVAALPVEIRCLTNIRPERRTPFRIKPNLVAIVSGTGPENVYRAMQELLRCDIRAVISWGTCAALSPDLQCGDLLLPELIIEDGDRYFTDKSWADRVRGSIEDNRLNIHHGSMTIARSILADKKQKMDLYEKTGAWAADMESAGIIKTAQSLGLPCLVIRAVLDEVDTAIPGAIIKHTDEFGTADVPGLIKEIVQAPRLLAALSELALSLHKAVRTLKIVARRTNHTLLCPSS